jgi:drug/metabolite transporter (DMT)-like permease
MSTGTQTTPTFSRAQLFGYISLCLIWGSTWLAIRVVVRDVPPLQAAAVRFLAAAVLLLTVVFLQKRSWPKDKREWNAIFVLSVTVMAVPYGLLFWAEQYVTSSMTAIFYSAMPMVVALLTLLITQRKVPRSAVYAMLVAFGALLFLFYDGLSATGRGMLGGAAVVFSMVLSAWSVVYAKKRLRDVDSVVATGLQLLCGAVVLFWGMWALESHRHAVWTKDALLAMVFLTLFGSAAAFVIYYWLLKTLHPYQLSTVSLVTPVIAVLEGALLWGEQVSLFMLIAVAVVLGSIGVVLRAEKNAPSQSDDILMLRDSVE